MPNFRQTWTCRACGHAVHRYERRPKYGYSHRHLPELERRARCTQCGARGCVITEILASQAGTWLDPEAGISYDEDRARREAQAGERGE